MARTTRRGWCQSGGGPPHSKTLARMPRPPRARSALECASPLALFHCVGKSFIYHHAATRLGYFTFSTTCISIGISVFRIEQERDRPRRSANPAIFFRANPGDHCAFLKSTMMWKTLSFSRVNVRPTDLYANCSCPGCHGLTVVGCPNALMTSARLDFMPMPSFVRP